MLQVVECNFLIVISPNKLTVGVQVTQGMDMYIFEVHRFLNDVGQAVIVKFILANVMPSTSGA